MDRLMTGLNIFYVAQPDSRMLGDAYEIALLSDVVGFESTPGLDAAFYLRRTRRIDLYNDEDRWRGDSQGFGGKKNHGDRYE